MSQGTEDEADASSRRSGACLREPGADRACMAQEPVRGMLKMIKKKRYGGLILLMALFLAFRPASALCVYAAENSQSAGHHDSGGEASEKKSKMKFEMPQVIKDYRFDPDVEKKRLAEAISKLDELGFSPEKMAERFWTIISRKENREKIGKAAEDLKENTGRLIEKASGAGTDSDSGKNQSDKSKSGKDQSDQGNAEKDDSGKDESAKQDSGKGDSVKEGSGEKNPADSQSDKDSDVKVRKSVDTPLYERAVDEADRVKEKVREEASKKVDEAIDKAAEAAADYAVKEINETAEKVKEEVR